jgi:hypothetical protein
MPPFANDVSSVNSLIEHLSPIFAGVKNARTAFLSLHPDYREKPIDVHPNNIDNWLADNEDSFSWVLTLYGKLVSEKSSELLTGVVTPGDHLTIFDIRNWVKSNDTSKLRSYPYEIVSSAYGELDWLLAKYTTKDLREASYRQQHPPDTTFFEAIKPITKVIAEVAPYIQIVASFVPGIGTIASVAIGATVGALEGKSLDEIAESAAAAAVPGGPLVVASAKAVVNIGKAAVTGQNILKATGNAVYSSALQYIDDPKLRSVADKAIKGIVSGQNVLSVAEQSAIEAAISRIPDKNAQALVTDAIHGKVNPKSILSSLANSDVGKTVFSESLIAATKTIGNANSLAVNARDEIVATASNFVSDKSAREAIGNVTSKVLTGKKAAESEIQAAKQALATVKEPAAKKVLESIINGNTDPKTVFASTDSSLVQVLVKTDLNSNVSRLLMADASTLPNVNGPVTASDVIPGTLKDTAGKTTRGKFMQLSGVGKPSLQFQPEGSKNWLVGFWFQVQ